MFLMHGCIFLHLKTTGSLHKRITLWMWYSYGFFVFMYLIVTVETWLLVPHATTPFLTSPIAWVVVLINVLAVTSIPIAFARNWSGRAFVASCLAVGAFVTLLGIALFPNLVRSMPHIENSLTIYNAASSQKTLGIMLIVAGLGMPFVLAYTSVIYWVFRDRVAIGSDNSYGS